MSGFVEAEIVSTTAVEAINRAEVDIQIATAKKWPRSIDKFRNESKAMACSSEEIAMACFYRLERKGKGGEKVDIQGPSIRLAEICSYNYQNIRFGSQIIDIDQEFVTARGACHDLERNVFSTSEVKRRITSKDGYRYSADMIQTTAQAACAIAIRNAIFQVIPRAYVDDILKAAKRVAIGDQASLQTRLQKSMEWFGKAGVSKDQVLAKIGRTGPEHVTLEDIEKLAGFATAIIDSEETIENLFPPIAKAAAPAEETTGTKADGLADRIGKKKKEKKSETAEGAGTPQPVEPGAAATPSQPPNSTGSQPPVNPPSEPPPADVPSDKQVVVGELYDKAVELLGSKSVKKLEMFISEATNGKVQGWTDLSKFTDEVINQVEAKIATEKK